MRLWLCSLFVILSCVLVAPGCASHRIPESLSPAATAAFVGTEAIHALDQIRDIAVIANESTPPFLSVESTRKIVTYHKSAITVIHDAPSGWKPTVETGLNQLLGNLSEADRRIVGPYVELIRAIIKEVH